MKRKILIIGIILLIVLVIMYFYFRIKSTGLINNSNSMDINESDFPLSYGDRGENVRKLQKFLNTKVDSGLQLDVDGIFGYQTELTLQWVFEIEKVSREFFIQNNINNY